MLFPYVFEKTHSIDRLLSDLLYYRTSFDCHIRCRGAHSEGLWRGRMTGSGRISMNVESGSLWEGDAMATVPGDTITKSLMRYFGDRRGGHSPWHPCPRFSFILVPQFQTIVWEKPQWNSYFSKIDMFFFEKNHDKQPTSNEVPWTCARASGRGPNMAPAFAWYSDLLPGARGKNYTS